MTECSPSLGVTISLEGIHRIAVAKERGRHTHIVHTNPSRSIVFEPTTVSAESAAEQSASRPNVTLTVVLVPKPEHGFANFPQSNPDGSDSDDVHGDLHGIRIHAHLSDKLVAQ